jgi:hypothetical protein
MIMFLIILLFIEIIFKPRPDWNYETKRIMIWYSWNKTRKLIQL